MKKLLILLFSILISFNSYGEWILVSGDDIADGYIETDTITKQNEYVYFWILQNKHTRDKYGSMSAMIYTQGDCGINRDKTLTIFFYTEPMGKGEKIGEGYTPENPEWNYQMPGSIGGTLLSWACKYVK